MSADFVKEARLRFANATIARGVAERSLLRSSPMAGEYSRLFEEALAARLDESEAECALNRAVIEAECPALAMRLRRTRPGFDDPAPAPAAEEKSSGGKRKPVAPVIQLRPLSGTSKRK